ncbi:MAG: hypothetical protein PHW74_02820 [Desulfobacca sp.]|nr:hypothetical protein [Desulfobacca sp.]
MRIRSVVVILLSVFWWIGHPVVALAADWSVVPAVTLRGEYDSNLNFSFGEKRSDYIVRLSPTTDYNYKSETLQLTGRLAWHAMHYFANSNVDKIDQNYSILSRYLTTPRLSLTFNGSYIVDSTLQEELTASGLIMTRTPREFIRATPGLAYNLTERAVLTWDYGYDQVNYQDPDFTDYYQHRTSLGLNYLMKNEKTTLRGNILGRMTKYPDIDNDYRILGTYAGVEHMFSENWSVSLMGGLNFAWYNFQTAVLDFSDFPFLVFVRQQEEKTFEVSPYFSLSTTRRWTNTSLDLGYSRDQSASAGGTVFEANRAYVALSHAYSEKLRGVLRGHLYLSESTGANSNYQSLVMSIAPELTYKLTEKLSVGSGYNLSWRQAEEKIRQSANRHLVWVFLNYSYPVHYQK